MSVNQFDYIVVGAGIVGAATAYKLQLKYPEKSIALLEKEDRIGKHQTGRNSGVIHSGIYYKPGSYKAENCRIGREQLLDFAQKYNIPYELCGKIIVATTEAEIPALENIYNRGIENQTPDIRYINADDIKSVEPYIVGVKGISVPSAGIIDYVAANQKMADLIHELNPASRLILNCEYLSSITKEEKQVITTSQGVFTADKVILCTGLQSDRNAEKDHAHEDLKIVGFRGDYYEFKPEQQHKIKTLVYPVPDPNFPFLGVHFTKMINGTVECGPNAVFTFAREKYSKTAFNFKDTFEALTYSGTWKLFSKFWRKGIDEYKRAFSKKLFVSELQKLMPQLEMDDLIVSKSGIRAQAIDKNGAMVDDFKIAVKGNNIHVLNAPSPAATACLSIADEIIGYLGTVKK
jgi:L-2-hydroxyglutarate oxidase